MKTISILTLTTFMLLLHGCISKDFMNIGKKTIYPCTIGCGNKGIAAPKGYVYYNNRLMSLDEFNRITHQHLTIQ